MSSSTATPSIESNRAKKRKLYMETEVEEETSNFPPHLAHIRTSERKVKDEVYTTLASLTGHGLSVRESCLAVVEVGNGMMGRQWKMPDRRNIREKMELIEAETLDLAVNKIIDAKEAGHTITHAIDSTTKKGVGTFATQGIHIGRNCPIPLPLMGISGESTKEVALQVDFEFQNCELSPTERGSCHPL